MKIRRTTLATSVGAIAIAALMLTGCSAGQSKADACKQMESKVSSISSDLQSHVSELSSDPSKASSAIEKLATTFTSSTNDVAQPDVKKAAGKAADALNDFSDQFKSYAADPANADTSKISDSSAKLQNSFNKLQKVCNS